MNRAGFGIRLVAVIIDAVILGIVYWIVSKIFTPKLDLANAANIQDVINASVAYTRRVTLISSVLYLAYALTEVFKAASPGKMILGLKIVDPSGNTARTDVLWKRWALKWSPTLIGLLWAITGIGVIYYVQTLAGLALLVGCFMALRPSKLALHDDLAGTAVVPANAPAPQGFQPIMPPPPPVPQQQS